MKFLYGILVLLALVVAALFLVPPFLDWEQFKPEITERLEAVAGRKLSIDGPIAVSILPSPTITAADVRVLNAPGAAAQEMARIKTLDLALALGPLLRGEVAITSLKMVEPVIELGLLPDGRPNWRLESTADAQAESPAAGAPESAAFEPARIDAATIRNGVIVYRRADGRSAERIERIDAMLSARTLDGPFRAEGRFSLRGRAIVFRLATGTIGRDRAMPISLEATFGGERGNALFEGTVRGTDGIPSFDGSVRVQAPHFGALLSALDVGRDALPEAPLASVFSAKGTLSASLDGVAARELQLRLGESQANGALSWQGGGVPSLDAKIALNRIDLDRYLPAGDGPETEPAAGTDGAGSATGAKPLDALQTVLESIRQATPGDLAGTLDLTVGTFIWRQGVIRQARTSLALDNGALTIRQASALLPGAAVSFTGRLTKGGDDPWLDGMAEIAADDLRAVLSWLAADVDAVSADRLRHLDASAAFAAHSDRISASDIDIRVDTTRIAGNASLETGMRPRLAARLAVDAVNIDAYLPAAGAQPAPETGATNAAAQEAAPGQAGDGGWTALAEIDADVELRIDALTYDGVRLAGLDLDAALEDGDLSVRRASAADAAGASISMAGAVRSLWTAPAFDLAVEGAAGSLDGVAALFDIDPDIRTEAFGKITLNGSLAGGADALTIDFGVASASAEARLAGTVETPFGTPAAALAVRLRSSDSAAIARAAGLTPPAAVERLGALAIDGGVGGDLTSAAIDLNVEAAGATLKVAGRIDDPFASPRYRVAVDIAHPRAEALIETVVGEAPADAALGALHVVGSVSGDASMIDIAGIDAAIGASRMSGKVSLRMDQEPLAVVADLRADALDLAWLGGGIVAPRETGAAANDTGSGLDDAAAKPTPWSDEPVDLAVLERLSGALTLDADALILGSYRIEQATVDLAAAAGTFTLRSLRGRLFDGALEADGSLAGGAVPTGQAAFRLTGANIGAILNEAAGVEAVSGDAMIDGYFTLRGQTAREIIRSLAGRVSLASRAGAVEGVDLPAISRQIGALAELDTLDDIESFVARTKESLSNGRTTIRSLDGAVRVQDGQARFDGFRIVANEAVGDISGSADLPAWQVDLTVLFRLVEHPDAPPVGMRLEGSIDRPARHYLIKDMQTHLVRLGLLSLARTSNLPKITIRKGAKAEPGTEMDTLLRDVLGDPDKAEQMQRTEEETKKDEDLDAAEEPTRAERADDPEEAVQPAKAETVEQTEESKEGAEAEEAVAADAAEERAQRPADDPVQLPPPAPRRDRDAGLRDFVDDLLRTLEEEQEPAPRRETPAP